MHAYINSGKISQNSTLEKQSNLTDPWESWKAKDMLRFYILRELFQQVLCCTSPSQLAGKKQNDNKLARNTYEVCLESQKVIAGINSFLLSQRQFGLKMVTSSRFFFCNFYWSHKCHFFTWLSHQRITEGDGRVHLHPNRQPTHNPTLNTSRRLGWNRQTLPKAKI